MGHFLSSWIAGSSKICLSSARPGFKFSLYYFQGLDKVIVLILVSSVVKMGFALPDMGDGEDPSLHTVNSP